MTAKSLALLNRRIDVIYRIDYLGEPLLGLAERYGLTRQGLKSDVDKARMDKKVMEAVRMRVRARARRADERDGRQDHERADG